MTVRMVGEKLAREARGTTGVDAAGKTDRLKAAVQECRTAGVSSDLIEKAQTRQD
eukprot:COSAG02_NODE_7000_length_3234_cov_1.806699_1_plen_55_part_00